MKLNKTIQEMQENLKKAIYEASVNSKVQEKIIEQITKRGYRIGFISGVFEGNIMLDTLTQIDLGVFALEIYKVTQISYINPEIYFTEIEMDRIINHKVETEKDVFEYPVVFEDVKQVSGDTWITVLSAEFIAKLGRSNMLNYEFETQRDAKIIETSRGVFQTPNINPKSIIEISEELITDTFIPNVLTFNIPLRNSDNFKYDKRSNKWMLLKGKLNIIDGYHRYRGILAALEKKNINYNFEIRLANFDNDKARKFIVQEDKRNPISKEYIKSIDNTDLITQTINQLNQNSRSELRGKITADRTTIKTGYAWVSFDMMHKTISKLWNINTINEADELFEYLRKFFNKVIDIVKFSNNDEVLDERMFVFYLIIAKRLETNEELTLKLEDIINKINNSSVKNEFMGITPSEIIRRFNRYYKVAEKSMGVVING